MFEIFLQPLLGSTEKKPVVLLVRIMATEKDFDINMDDSGNSCGSSVISESSGPSFQSDLYDGDGVQMSDLETEAYSNDPYSQVHCCYGKK